MKKILIISLILLLLTNIIWAGAMHKIISIQQIDDHIVSITFEEITTARGGNFLPTLDCELKLVQQFTYNWLCKVEFIQLMRPK